MSSPSDPGRADETGLDRADRAAGAMLGQALGDALGFVVEAAPQATAAEYVQDWLRGGRAGERAHPDFPFGQYSDDTQLARELMLSLVDASGWDPAAFGRRVAAVFHEGRAVGAGQGTRAAAERLQRGVPWQDAGTPAPYAGNGSAMRVGPVGVLFGDSLATLRAVAIEQSRVTHRDARCAAGAVAVGGAVALAARAGAVEPAAFLEELAELLAEVEPAMSREVRAIEGWIELPPSAAARRLDASRLDAAWAGRGRGISPFVVPSVIWSLYAFLRSPGDYWETVCTAISVGGDTDTMAAIAGAIAGARLGPGALPHALVARLNDRGEWGAPALEALARACSRVCAEPSARGRP